MHHIYTSIVFRHLATRGHDTILRTPAPHNSSYEEIFSRLTCRTLAQPRTYKSPFLKSYLHKVNAKSHPSPLCPLCNTHTHNTHHIFNCTHICTTLSPLDLWTHPAGVTALLVTDRRIYYSQPNHCPARNPIGSSRLTQSHKMFLSKTSPCNTQICSCSNANMPCTSLCVCHGEHVCQNEQN